MSRFEGITLLSVLAEDAERTELAVRFHRCEIQLASSASPSNYTAEVEFAVVLNDVGIYPGHTVFAAVDPFFTLDHCSPASVSTLPTLHLSDVTHICGECPPSLQDVLRALSVEYLAKSGARDSTLPVEKVAWAMLRRKGDRFELREWADTSEYAV